MVGENVQSVTKEMRRVRHKESRWLEELPEKYKQRRDEAEVKTLI